MEPSRLTNRFDRFFRIEDAGSEDMFGSQAQTSRPSASRCQRQTSRCFETGIESRENRRTRLVAFGATMPDAMAGRTSRFAAATLSASFYTYRLHRPRRRECRRALRSRVSPESHGSPARHCDPLASPRQNVVTSSFRRVEQPQKSLTAHARSRLARRIPRGDLFIPGALVQGPDSLLDLHIADYPGTASVACFRYLARLLVPIARVKKSVSVRNFPCPSEV